MKPIAVITTVGTMAEAQGLARTLVEENLAACAQISEIQSYYVWNEQVQNETEFRILFKTTDQRYAAVEERIRQLHTYDLPAICATPFEYIYAPFAEWVAAHSVDH